MMTLQSYQYADYVMVSLCVGKISLADISLPGKIGWS